ncbi:MAG TPA: VWA domain-containing protein [Acidobacteria bacterium]|jgi:VWFA-related protein|nr:VWA domain-containing protein [Acidobacteriota bacterium]HIM15365.1 VWA domain-containing protein [Acidobacteriota bacterium]
MQQLRAALAVPAIVSIFLLAAVGLQGQSREHHILVSVLDPDDAPVGGLGISDFSIDEDGNSREILSVSQAGAGRQIALLVDTSQAATRSLVEFRNGLTAFVEQMSEGNQISIITFGGPPRIQVALTRETSRLTDGIGNLFALPDQAAYMLDALDQTAEGFSRQNASRPLIVVLTTEGIDYSYTSARRVIDTIEESGAAIYTLSLRVGRNAFSATPNISTLELRNQDFERDLLLERGPRNSGGRHRDLLTSLAINDAMQDIVSELLNQYLVVYSRPDTLVPPETITVRMNRQELTARGTPLRLE